MSQRYIYYAKVVGVYDGDTITVDLDLGFKMWVRGAKIRLYGINAPEVRGPTRHEGLVSRDYLRELILGRPVFIMTTRDKRGKYGRMLGTIFDFATTEEGSTTDFEFRFSINERMIIEKKAKRAKY